MNIKPSTYILQLTNVSSQSSNTKYTYPQIHRILMPMFSSDIEHKFVNSTVLLVSRNYNTSVPVKDNHCN